MFFTKIKDETNKSHPMSIKKLQKRIRELEHSRDNWKIKTEKLKSENARLEKELKKN